MSRTGTFRISQGLGLLAILFICASVSAWLVPARTVANIYYGGYDEVHNEETEKPEYEYDINRANNDGTALTTGHVRHTSIVTGLAIHGTYLYWETGAGNLARSKLDGTEVNLHYLDGLNEDSEEGLRRMAIAGEYVFWLTRDPNKPGHVSIGRATLGGSEVDRNFIPDVSVGILSLIGYGNYIYWTGDEGIGRAGTDGSGLEKSFIPTPTYHCPPCEAGPDGESGHFYIPAIAANSSYLYIALEGESEELNGPWEPPRIARVSRSGGTPDLNFITSFAKNAAIETMAATDFQLFWAENTVHLGRADADGNNVRHSVLCGGGFEDLAVDTETSEGPREAPVNCLLRERAPQIRLDAQESYRPDSINTILQSWGDEAHGFHYYYETPTELAEGEPYGNSLITPEGNSPVSSNPFLNENETALGEYTLGSPYGYPREGLPASGTDYLDERDGHYAEDAAALQEHSTYPPYSDFIYSRALKDENGVTWLQYWFFYYYNDSSFIGLSIGTHEGDWEMIQIRMDEKLFPSVVTFAQHESGAKCSWEELIHTNDLRPIVYPGVGTHASYPAPGQWELPSGAPQDDHADGEGVIIDSEEQVLSESEVPPWLYWPGKWGGTEPESVIPGEANSPTGPMFHSQWDDPEAFEEEAASCYEHYDGNPEEGAEEGSAPESPARAEEGTASPRLRGVSYPVFKSISAVQRGARVQVRFKLSGTPESDLGVILSLNPRGGSRSPLSTVVNGLHKEGKINLPFRLDPGQGGTVSASLLAGRWRGPLKTVGIR